MTDSPLIVKSKAFALEVIQVCKELRLAILNVSPGIPIYIDHKILLPGGYGGLLEVEFTLEKKMFKIHIGMRDIYV